jgi:Bifunctional DNA primase/polymerase, N-terminal
VSTEKRRRAAAALIRRGAAVIPVPAGEKNPGRLGWEALRITEEEIPNYWTNGQNVGLLCGKPSGDRVDVDLDVGEAAKIAGRFLPPTLTSGRESRPHSHWWYVSSDAESCDWKDTDGSKLVELRSTGRQTLVAPSTHPDGDEYLWHSETGLKMAEIGAAELTRRLRELVTTVLIARHLPPIRSGTEGGGRHDFALALAGFLLRPGRLGEDLTLTVLKAAWDAKGWLGEKERREAHRDLEGVVSDTAENLAAGEPVVGGPTLEEYAPGVVRLLCKWWGWERKPQTECKAEKEERRNQADRLIGYALEDVQELFVDQHGAPHALIDGEPVPLTSRCYSWLRRLMWEEEGRSVSGEYLKMAAGTLSAHAEFSGEVRELYTRAAWLKGVLYYELRPGKVVRVGPDGRTFEANPPVLFRRYVNLKALPDPEVGGSLDVLDELVNLKSERDRRLFKAYLVTLALEHVSRPIFNASGAMGSGKTTIGRVVKRTWDPTAPETVRFDPRDFLQKAMHAYIVMLDNQNTIPEWAADTLCRLVTGEADSKRRLYTDDEDVIIELRRAVILNGINVPTERGDVLDRSLVVELERIPDGDRKTEEQIWELFAQEHPRLLGALFDILSRAIALKPALKLSRRPRLADWGEYAACVYQDMGWGAETFLEDWDEVVRVQNQATLDGSPVAQAIIKFMEDEQEFTATSSETHGKLKVVAAQLGVDVERDKAWPKSARWLWRRIKEVLPLLVAAGIEANRMEDRSGSTITFRKMLKNDATNATGDENPTGKGKAGGNTGTDDATSNATTAPDATSNATRDSANRAESGNSGDSGNRFGDFSGEACTSEQEERIRSLVEEGMSGRWARRTVLASDHPLDCDCEVCL